MLAMAPPYKICTIRKNIEAKAVLVTSLDEFSRHYGFNKKNIILIGTALEVEIGLKATTLGRHRTFIVENNCLGGGDVKVSTINIGSVKFYTPEPLCPDTDGDGEDRAAATTMTTTGDTNIIDPVSIRVFEATVPDPLNDEALRVVVAQSMEKTPGRTLYTMAETGGSMVGPVIAHVIDASTIEMPPPPPLP